MAKRIPIEWSDAKAGDFAVGNGREFRLSQDGYLLSCQIDLGLNPTSRALIALGFTCEREVKQEPKVWKSEVVDILTRGPYDPLIKGYPILSLPTMGVGTTLWVSTREPLTFKEEE